MRQRLGCLSPIALGALALALAAIGVALLIGGGRAFSPGPLYAQVGEGELGGIRSHAETGGRCAACHPAPWSDERMADRCLACHEEIGRELDDAASLHGTFADLASGDSTLDCRECHTEHGGPDGALTQIDPAGFPHQATGYALDGHRTTAAGQPFVCADCHGDDLTHFEPAACDDCHRQMDAAYMQAHGAAFGRDCLACHDGVDRYGEQFDHGQTDFALAGAHAAVDCAGCHAGARTAADLQAVPQECYACHEDDDEHDGQFGRDCAGCHTTEDWGEATFDHSETSFPLTGQHIDVECAGCHEGGTFEGTPLECFACHEDDDEHDGQFGRDCAGCHTTEDWAEATFDHAATDFALTGRHVDVECARCHEGGTFEGTPQECYACHQDDDEHDGQFGRDCAACHTAADWAQVTFDHAATGFPLTGGHAGVDCAGCHQAGTFEGTPADCASCHDDPAYHRGLFGTACQECHTTADWAPARFDRPHRFPIDHGDSGASPCVTCHPDSLPAYTCYGCHEHEPAEIAEEHIDEGIADFGDCVRCHPTGREDEGGGGDD